MPEEATADGASLQFSPQSREKAVELPFARLILSRFGRLIFFGHHPH
jgi:hypothetical protein